jgi:putative mRNA 3-end processing factor
VPESLFEYHGGLHLKDTILWMDSPGPRSLCFISHAGVSGALGHQKIVSTALTTELLRALAAAYGRGRRAHEPQALVTPYGRPFHLGQLSLELFPSGHALGAASLLLHHKGQTIVYAGDINLRGNPLVEALEARPCDVLVLPARFGQQRWALPPAEETAANLVSFVGEALGRGQNAVLLCAALGEAQEVALLLQEAGLRVQAHRRVAALCKVYQEGDGPLAPVPQFRGPASEPVALLWPCELRRSRSLESLKGRCTALVSGAALDAQVREGLGQLDATFALSAHADYGALLEYVRACNPGHVVLVGGTPRDLQRDLQGMGMEVELLAAREQMELF